MTTKYPLKEKTKTHQIFLAFVVPSVTTLKKQLHALTKRYCMKEAELSYNLKAEQTKTHQFEQAQNEHIKSLQHDIEVKQQIINTTKSSLNSLKQDIERAQDEILSLKSHIGSLSSKTDTQFKEPTNRHKTKDASMERKTNSSQ